jgi:hypothetical protein
VDLGGIRPHLEKERRCIDPRGELEIVSGFGRKLHDEPAILLGSMALFQTVLVACGEDGKPLKAAGMGLPWRGHREEALSFSEGLAPFRTGAYEVHDDYIDGAWHGFYYKGGKWGYLARDGKVAIPAQFDAVKAFAEGLAAVAVGTQFRTPNPKGGMDVGTSLKYGYIDRSGKMVIEAKFDNACAFCAGIARVEIGDDWNNRKIGYIDKTGKYVWEPTK